jgi:hypothetical protein
MDRLWLKMAEVPAGVHYVAAPATVINLFAVGPFNDISYHVIALSVDLMHKTSSASFGPNNWLMVTYQSLNAFGDWRNHPACAKCDQHHQWQGCRLDDRTGSV